MPLFRSPRPALSVALLALLGAPAALASEEVSYFTFDSLLVTPIQPVAPDPELAEEAARIGRALQDRLARSVLVLDIDEVPDFEVQGYDAHTYVASCPPGEYPGCALVVGQRAEADWAVGGTLRSLEDDLLGIDNQRLLEVHFLDIRANRELLAFGVVLDAENPHPVLEQVAAVFDRILEGAFELVDVRGQLDDPEVQAQIDRARDRLIAESLDQLEQALGEVDRPVVQRDIRAPRLTREALKQQYEGRDDLPPWERVGMTEAEFVRFRNSGRTLEDWRQRKRGRFGQVMVRGALGAGAGPFGVHHEGRYLVAFDDELRIFVNREVAQVQELAHTPTFAADAEIAFGVLPFLDLGFAVTSRSGQVTFRFAQETEGQPFDPGPRQGTNASTIQLGPRLTFAPMPQSAVRPHLGLGLSSWRGRGVPPEQEVFQRLQPPTSVLLTVLPGVEGRLTRSVDFFVRGAFDQRLGGRLSDTRREGEPGLSEPPTPSDPPGMGVGIQVGFQMRLTVLPDRRPADRRRFDDEL